MSKVINAEIVETTEMQKSVGKAFGYTPEQVAVVQHSVAKGTSKIELAYFLNVCKTMDMNPFNKEVWCYKDNKGNLLIFSGRDGFLSKAQKNPLFNGIRSCEVREKDEWEIDIPNGAITHKITKSKKNRGDIILGYAIVFRKDGEPTIEIADFDTYNKGYNTWRTHPEEMIKKTAESHALKKAFGISGIQSEHDFSIKNGVASSVIREQSKEYVRITNTINKATTLEELEQVKPHLKDQLHIDHYNVVESKLNSEK